MISILKSVFVILPILGWIGVDGSVITQAQGGVQPFRVDLSKEVPHMLQLIKSTVLPEKEMYPGLGSSYGIDLAVLKRWQKQWLTEFDWEKEQADMNKFKHFTTMLEGNKLHFIHEKSKEQNAIPLLLLHGWPGSFLEFVPLIKELTGKAKTAQGKAVSFDVIIPSLPGFGFSSPAPANWTTDDTTRILHSLMIDVLGYKTFAVHGTDWGVVLAYNLYEQFTKTVRAGHFVFLPFPTLSPEERIKQNITLSLLEEFEEKRALEWGVTGNGYLIEQTTKPNTIGLALYDNPMGQLAWIGEKLIDWSDPRAGTGPSVLTSNQILRGVSLYYLTKSFVSSAFIYAQNPKAFRSQYTKANTDAPMLFSAFKYNTLFWPPAVVSRLGNLVYYKNHDFGGHLPGLDNPPAMIEDLREIDTFWEA